MAQEQTNDTLTLKKQYGLRLGVDLAKPIRTLLDSEYSGFEITGDFRITPKWYIAGEIGNDRRDYNESNLSAISSGSYIKLGADYNAYNNWLQAKNAIYAGPRIGFASFKQELLSYDVFTSNPTFPVETVTANQEFTGLNAIWIELILGIKTEVLQNLYLSVNAQIKMNLSEKTPENFGNLFIPGFNQTNDFSKFGIGYGYTISYLVPFFNK